MKFGDFSCDIDYVFRDVISVKIPGGRREPPADTKCPLAVLVFKYYVIDEGYVQIMGKIEILDKKWGSNLSSQKVQIHFFC